MSDAEDRNKNSSQMAVPGGGKRLSTGPVTDEEDDYSASINAVLQKRASQRKSRSSGKRKSSSPRDRRRSSVFTTSSGDTAITLENLENPTTQEEVFENIKIHKELLQTVKQQPWDMRRKLKLISQAKKYISRHEGQLQERLAHSHSTKDILARFNIVIVRYWQYIKRQIINMMASLVPWEMRIKEIESHFGSVVASYFTFLRWIFWINIVLSVILICFVIIPEVIAADKMTAGNRKILLPSEVRTATHLSTLWEFEGVLKHSPFFYGFYTDQKHTREGYPLPLSYFMTGMAVYIYSFVAILRKMAFNSRQSKLSEKEDECAFSWRLFTAWDYMIAIPETAFNRFASITMGFKEALLEEKEKKKDERNWKVISLRILANLLILLLLGSSAYAVILVVRRSEKVTEKDSWWRQNEITLALSLITTIFPNIFELVGMLENYHPRKQLRWQLARIMVLNFLNLYTLIIALFGKVNTMTEELQALRPNVTLTPPVTPSLVETSPCNKIPVNCTLLDTYASYEDNKKTQAVMVFVANLSSLLPGTEVSKLPSGTVWNANTAGIYNLTGLMSMIHGLATKANNEHTHKSASDIISETWSNFAENETYTFWSNQSTLGYNNTLLPIPENDTALVLALPHLIEVISSYVQSVFPVLSKTTSVVEPTSLYPSRQSSSHSEPSTAPPTWKTSGTSYSSTSNENDYKSGRGSTLYSISKPVQSTLGSSTISSPGTSDSALEKLSRSERSNKIPHNDSYTHVSNQPPVSKPDILELENGYFVLNIGENTLSQQEWYEFEKSSTRGDIPGDFDAKTTPSSVTSTTESPEDIQNFLTNILTIITMIFLHNSTRYDEANYTKIQDFSKWITTLENTVETKEITDEYFNSTLNSKVRVDIDETKKKTCFVTVCENGTTDPRNLHQFFNCSTNDDNLCLINAISDLDDESCTEQTSLFCTKSPEPIDKEMIDTDQKLRKLCWETMFGQELVKLTVMDLIFTVGFILVLDFIRAVIVRLLNPCWCWDLEKKFPQYGDFKIAENILHLVNNQGMIWMGMFFSPGLPVLNIAKLYILMYIRSWAVMTCNVPHETVFRASRSNNFYFALLLFMLFLCTLPVAYGIVWLEPSWHCGPFSSYKRIYQILTQAIFDTLPTSLHKIVAYIASPGIVIPLLVLLTLIIYYLLSLTSALREANVDLKFQLRRERTEERRKMFKIAGDRDKKEDPMQKWKKLIPMARGDTDTPENKKSEVPKFLTSGKMTGFAGAAKRAALEAREQRIQSCFEEDGNNTDVDQVSLPDDQDALADIHVHSLKASQKSTAADTTARSKPSSSTTNPPSRSEIPVIKISKNF